jgi:hypothetical protein
MLDFFKKNQETLVSKSSKRFALISSATSVLAACGAEDQVTQGGTSTVDTPLIDTTPTTQPPALNDVPPVEVSLLIETQEDATIDESGVTTLNVVFKDDASVDGANFAEAAVINLGLTEDGTTAASDGRADFDELVSETTYLNIHDTTQNVELDFAAAAESAVTINLMHEGAAIQVGEEVATGSNTAIELLNISALTVNHMSDQAAEIAGGVDLDDNGQDPDDEVVESLLITTSQQGGDLSIGRTALTAAFENTGTLRDVSINAVDGDMVLKELANDRFMLDITELQNYHVQVNDADVEIGRMGACNLKSDMEVISLRVIDEGSLFQRWIEADVSDIATVTVKSQDKNTLDSTLITTAATGQYNVIFEGLSAESVRLLTVDTTDGGAILLANQSYAVDNIVLIGGGDVTIEAGENCGIVGQGFEQGNIDTTDFEGDLTIITGDGDDTINGSDGDDTIILDGEGDDTINDSPGDDTIAGTSTGDGTLVYVDSCSAGSDDTLLFFKDGFTDTLSFEFHAGSGNDYIALETASDSSFGSSPPTDVLFNFGSWCEGVVCINVFTPSTAGFTTAGSQFNFVGLDGIVANNFVNLGGGTVTSLASSSIYNVSGNPGAISDYSDLSAIAPLISADVSDNTSDGDAAIFIVSASSTSYLGPENYSNAQTHVPLQDTGNNYNYYTY